jgi:(1->4)-alpha-D-glucan 1-alpha-D-glucosylmutase
MNTLARIALHHTSPGTPDTYQGDELWNFTLVDPDNRQQVDFDARETLLSEISNASIPPSPLERTAKLDLVHRLLSLRRERAELFTRGTYVPIEAVGPRANHVVAFARSLGDQHTVTIASRLVYTLDRADASDWWSGTRIVLPESLRGSGWRSVFDPSAEPGPGTLELADLLRTIPVAVLAR